MRTRTIFLIPIVCGMAAHALGQAPIITGIDFADDPGKLYISVPKVASALALNFEGKPRKLTLAGKPLRPNRWLFSGTPLLAVGDLRSYGVSVTWDEKTQTASLALGSKTAEVMRGVKRAEVNIAKQQLHAYQGDVLVLDTHVSTGRKGHRTPSGSFAAHEKERIHYSRLYDDAPMPWAVNIDGNVFIHGFTSVPRFPASHGCIRVSMRGGNPARWFWHWVSIGTPVRVAYDWTGAAPSLNPRPTAMNPSQPAARNASAKH